jgi:hypothetical protein
MTTVDRRARFRDYMRRLDPTASPALAMDEGFYVPPPSAVASRIGARLDIEPSSSHLLLGGIGSGKTTELLAVRSHLLSTIPDAGVVMVDVLTRQRESKLEPGILLVLAGVELLDWISRRHSPRVDATLLQGAARTIRGVAYGRVEEDETYDDPSIDYGQRWVPGVLEAPARSTNLEEVADCMNALLQAIGLTFTMLFDGLDRVPEPHVFSRMVRVDVPLMKRASVGMVVVGPQSLRFESDRAPQESFSEVHLHGSINIQIGGEWAYLHEVLRRRVGADILPEEACERLVDWSGGVVRDLISLARAAGEVAYSLGHDAVYVADVDIAADRFGRGLVLGMTKDMLERLSQLTEHHRHTSFWVVQQPPQPGVIATDADVSLVLHRVLIEVPGTPVQYLVHPTIVPLLPQLLRKTA